MSDSKPESQATRSSCPECSRPIPSHGANTAPARYCSHCGQKLAVGSFKLREVLGELLGAMFTLELPILRTFRALWKGPGHVANAWIEGKRRTYISPIKFVVIIGLIVALTYKPILELRHAMQEKGTATYEVGVSQYTSQYFALICLGLLIPIASICHGLGKAFDVKRSTLDWYVLGLYSYGLAVTIQLLMNLSGVLIPSFANSVPVQTLEGFMPVILFTWGAASFVDKSRRWHAVTVAFLGQVFAYIGIGLAQGLMLIL